MALTLTSKPNFHKAIDYTDLADSTKKQYKKAIDNAVKAGVDLTDTGELIEYAQTLGQSSKAFLKAAIKLWSKHLELQAKGGATPDNVDVVQATIYRFEALNEAIKVKATNGKKTHIWLSQAETKELIANCDQTTLKGRRDRIVLGLLTGAGLRREELVNLTSDDIIHQPIKGQIRAVLSIRGKGDKGRTVPISDNLATALDDWKAVTGNGPIARRVGKGDRLGDKISPVGVFNIVNRMGATIGKPDLAPHDLRRTYAQIGYEAGVPITQISKLLGHSSVATTQRYLNLDLDLETTIGDFVPFE
jgi:integrase